MEILVTGLRGAHIVFGSIGLIAFWVPIFTRKGSPRHKQFGRIFKWSAYIMLAAAGTALAIRFTDLLLEGRTPAEEPYWFGLVFLLAQLIVMVFVTVRHGILVLEQKSNPRSLDSPLNRSLAWLSIAMSVLLLSYAVTYTPFNMTVLIALGLVGVISGIDTLRYIGGKKTGQPAWKLEHLGAMLGAGIAYHTAFAVFGTSRFVGLPLQGALLLVPWLLPTVIGIPAIILVTRHYRQQAGVLDAGQRN
jgi:hypothetical protein